MRLRRAIAVLLLAALPFAAVATPPCMTVTTTTALDLTPRTQLERVYYGAAVCYRQRWQDAVSATKSATAALAARDPETVAAIAPVCADQPEPSALPYLGLGALAGALLGGLAVWATTR